MKRPQRQGGYSLIELLVVLAMIAILSAVAIPQLLGAREKSRVASCDYIFHSLDGEIANEMDTMVHGGQEFPTCGDMGSPWNDIQIMRCIEQKHAEERNPRNRQQPAYINYYENPIPFRSCQVGLDENADDDAWQISILMRQVTSAEAPERTFSIKLD